jgi:hypothetical protein
MERRRACGQGILWLALEVGVVSTILLMLLACDDSIINPTGQGGDTAPVLEEDPSLVFDVTDIAFGDVEHGKAYQGQMSVTNAGAADLVISAITADSPFTVNPLSATITPGNTTQIVVGLTALEYGTLAGNLTFTSDDPDNGSALVTLSASVISDADGDGYDLIDAGGDDCDDDDIDVNPGASEIWYDGIDQNCDGLSDYDQDGDGYETDSHNENPDAGGGDCQDSNAEYHPYADDAPYDNRDTNCDGADDYDFDGDGSRSEDYGKGLDCDDNDPDVNISADEQLNGKDDDCDGSVDTSCDADLSERVYIGRGNHDRAGYSVALGDLDEDGYAEVIVGSPYYNASSASASGRGMIGVISGSADIMASTDLGDADEEIQGSASSDGLGNFVTVMGDYDGDGVPELSISALTINSNGGAVYLISGDDVMRGRDTSDALLTMSGSSSEYLGRGVATDVDLDGDGMSELIASYTSSSNNAVAVQYGGSGGSIASSSADARWTYTGSAEPFYRNMGVGADLDGDGYDDLMFSDGGVDSPSTDAGSVWVVWGQPARFSGTTSFGSVSTVIGSGASSSAGFGTASQVGPDLTGDGISEIWIYSDATALEAYPGGAYLRAGTLDQDAPLVTYTWSTTDIATLRRGGDFGGDGIDDMFLGMPGYSLGSLAWIDSEVCCGTAASPLEFVGRDYYGGYAGGTAGAMNGKFGYGMAPLGADIDGDGDADYLAGDPEKENASEYKEGAAYVMMNEHL